jgi:Rrf2 family protein
MLSRTADYALRAVLLIARLGPERARPATQNADSLGVPRNYLAKTLNRLARRGVLESMRGVGGGYRLVKSPTELSIADIVTEFDEVGLRNHRCMLGDRDCNPELPCAGHDRWMEWSGTVSRLMQQTTVADLLGGGDGGPDPVSSMNNGIEERR